MCCSTSDLLSSSSSSSIKSKKKEKNNIHEIDGLSIANTNIKKKVCNLNLMILKDATIIAHIDSAILERMIMSYYLINLSQVPKISSFFSFHAILNFDFGASFGIQPEIFLD